MFRSFFKYIKSVEKSDFKVIDMHCDSHGAGYQKASVVYVVSQLLDRGVDSSDIYVIVEWSQPNRLFVNLPNEYCDYITSHANVSENSFVLDSNFKKSEIDINLPCKFESLFVVIGDDVYGNPEHLNIKEIRNSDLKKFVKSFVKSSEIYHHQLIGLKNILKVF